MDTKNISVEQMEGYVARFSALRGSDEAYIDSRLPGHERLKINLIGMGVVEAADKPELQPNIPLPAHGFNLGMIQAEPGNGAALHAHQTEEVFMPLSGRWSIFWGPEGEREVILETHDVISVPIHVMRGFRNVGDETAMMLAVVGGHDPGRVGWPDSMKEMAASAGLVLDDDGNLIEVDVS